MTKVSVVVPTLNEEQLIGDLLQALYNQSISPLEIIIVDSSTDKTALVAASWRDRFQAKNCQLIILTAGLTKGIAFARQTGFQRATSPIIASTDCDCTPRKDWIEQIILFMTTHPDCAAVVGNQEFVDGPFIVRWLAKLQWYRWYFYITKTLLGFSLFYSNNGAVRADAFLQAGGFNTTKKSIHDLDDAELGARLSRVGKIQFCPKMIVQSRFRWFNRSDRNTSTLSIRINSLLKIAKEYHS
ncbi:glycosyltransferase family 2 protein [Candidatus Woesebacteria bacterium]|nr:glycosyltransferase family 2 protein [Candidatus Woesebacteria bacterium]